MTQLVTVGEAAKEIPCKAKSITDFLSYYGLPDVEIPVVSGRRIIPRWALPQLREAMRKAGKLPA
jgi:hypothetical protein